MVVSNLYLCIQGRAVDESGTLLCGPIMNVATQPRGIVTLIVQLSGNHGDLNKHRPQSVALRLSLVYCHKSLTTVYCTMATT